jgi:hypothetical protein
MKRRIIKTFTVLLLMIVAIAGFMPSISREVQAETTKQIVFDKDTIDGIHVYLGENFSKDGITLDRICEPYQLADGESSYVHFGSGYIYICHGSFTFSSSIGKISKIEIECRSAYNVPSGWTVSDDYSDLTVTWQGDPSYTVMINNEAENRSEITQIENISKMTFTIITEDVTGITLDETSLEMKPGDTKTLTATLSPSTATEKEVKWSSSNTSVATVSDSGLITAVAVGEATITATATNGTQSTSDDRSATCKVTVKNPEPVVTKYPLYVGKNQVTSEYLKNETEGWSYDPASNTLYLDNAKITDTNTYIVTRDCISYKGSPSDVLTISLSGNSTVGDENAQYAIETYASSLIITGNGSLTINAEYEVIDSGISLTIKDVSITANTGGIFSMRGMVINNSTVTVSNGTLWNSEKSIKITDSRVEVTDEPYGVGIGSDYSNISISGDSYVKADVTGSESKEEKFAMLFVDSLELKDGVEIVEPEEAEISNYKLPGTTSNTYSIFEKGSTTPAQKVIIARTYTIKFVNDDGTELQSSKVITGEIPKYEGDTPTKPSDGKYEYTFKGWDKEITEAKADATYTAVFESKEITTPQPDPKPVTPFPIPKTGIE